MESPKIVQTIGGMFMPEQVHVRETNSEILVFIDQNMPDKLAALEEGVKILQREVLREKANLNNSNRR